eukprot:7378921-Prymnesium_polylepis.1
MHSLTTRDGSDMSDQIKDALARGETELEILPPLSINVVPDVSKRQRRRLIQGLSLSSADVIIPIKLGPSEIFKPSSQWAATNAMPTQLYVQDHAVRTAIDPMSQPGVMRGHLSAVSLALAADYKVQGRTLDKLILSIGDRPFEPYLSLPSLYVLASRVRKRAHLRVLGWTASTDASRLRALRHPPELAIWHATTMACGTCRTQ